MEIHTKLVDLILTRREPFLGQLLTEKKGFNNFEHLKPNLLELLKELDGIFYTLDFLEREKLISITRNRRSESVNIFNGFTKFNLGKEDEAIFGPIFYLNKLGTKDYAMSWQVEMQSGLLAFRNNGYKTNEQRKEQRNFWLAILVGIGSAVATAILSSLLTKTPIFNCFY